MKRVFIGHRGVGKSALLERHAHYFPGTPHLDLDAAIEKKVQLSIAEFFRNKTEDHFRKIELETYHELVKLNPNYVIAVGAGFSVDQIGAADEVIFMTRVTDADGRLFLNRPRLDQNISSYEESKLRFRQRDSNFRQRADFIYNLSEGLQQSNQTEKRILSFRFKVDDAYYTLTAKEVALIKKKMQNFSKIELRTDLISKIEILKILKSYPLHQWLVSYRTEDIFECPANVEKDCDTHFYKNQKISILSSHEDSIDKAIQNLGSSDEKFQLKLSPIVENFADLKKGHQWQQQSPNTRSFLPRSIDGKWNWFRQLSKSMQKINFVRNMNQQADQPSLFQWLDLPAGKTAAWAAVIGKPIHFSRSPLRHEEFFQKKETFMCAICVDAEEFSAQIKWLSELGLRYAAVTSPLKSAAFLASTRLTTEAQELKSVNTLLIISGEIFGHNTDLAGFKSLKLADSKTTAVWGGGGTLEMMKKVIPSATYFSSQTGNPRFKMIDSQDYTTLVWAAPRSEKTLLPPTHWPIKIIFDLNYVENSMGLEYAQNLISDKKQLLYISGLQMFDEQATMQQEFWSAT